MWRSWRCGPGWPLKASRPTSRKTPARSGLGSNYKAVIFMSPTRDTMTLHGKQVTVTVNTSVNASIDAPRRTCASTSARAAASSASTTRSAPNTTGRGTKACSATPTSRSRRQPARHDHHGQQRSSTAGIPPTCSTGRVLQPDAVSDQGQVLSRVDEDTLAVRRTVHPGTR